MSDPDVILAVHEGDYPRLATIIESGADLNTFQREGEHLTALMVAVSKVDHVSANMLITNGANLDIQYVRIILLFSILVAVYTY